jgi:TRAP-type C4-dicarboxylate transport system permease small subunit
LEGIIPFPIKYSHSAEKAMQSVKYFFVRAGRIYIKSIEWTGAVLIVLVSLAMLEAAFSRTVMHFPLSAIDKINVSLMIWACFLVNSVLILEDKHIQINILPAKLRGLRLSILRLVINLALLATCLVTAIYGFEVAKITYETGVTFTAEIDLPQWPTFLAVPVGMALAVPVTVYLIARDVSAVRDHLRKRGE